MERFKYWTSEDDQFLRENWSSFTIDQLADKLDRTRNSVAGRVHRLGLPSKVKRAVNNLRINRRPLSGVTGKAPSVPVPPDEPPTQYSCTMSDLDRTRCRWPIGDPQRAGFRYCGTPEADFPKVPYCTYHQLAQYDLGRKQ